ncbi:NAD(P)H-binding protein [Pseudonocardia cypriaca]|uniref:NAD(P)H-binding protein n=1 Tax=Pseudonocardia cypriaca TaxID=882449 RepID=UPI001FE7211A|nr:NAD(P)H-binding protein [Pseudonocardia cypriaca]
MVRDPARLAVPPRPGLTIVTAGLDDRAAVLRAVEDADMLVMEEVVRASGLDWTIMPPPRLTDRPATGGSATASTPTCAAPTR